MNLLAVRRVEERDTSAKTLPNGFNQLVDVIN
jgi:hypothetical protein